MVLGDTGFADGIRRRIEDEYARGPWRLGWRLLYSPVDVLDAADVALVGLNPGGDGETEGHGVFAMSSGSAYLSESWGGVPPGQARLQRQVRDLCTVLGVAPERVLAGNLVPFRSADFRSLPDPERAIRFGADIWDEMLRRVGPRLVITMGRLPERSVSRALGARLVEAVPSGWGNVKLRRWTGKAELVALPHLSRYALFGRTQCDEPLGRVLAHRDRWGVRADGPSPESAVRSGAGGSPRRRG